MTLEAAAIIPCPDCGFAAASRDEFVAHRETEHPPAPIVVSGAGGIQSTEAFGTDPKE